MYNELTQTERDEAERLGLSEEQMLASKAVDRSRQAARLGLSLNDFDQLESALDRAERAAAASLSEDELAFAKRQGITPARYSSMKGVRTEADWRRSRERFPSG